MDTDFWYLIYPKKIYLLIVVIAVYIKSVFNIQYCNSFHKYNTLCYICIAITVLYILYTCSTDIRIPLIVSYRAIVTPLLHDGVGDVSSRIAYTT